MEHNLNALSVRALTGLLESKDHDIEILETLRALLDERIAREKQERAMIAGKRWEKRHT